MANEEEEYKDGKIKVVDRRRFDAAGDEREQGSNSKPIQSTPINTGADFEMKPSEHSPEIDFSGFVMSMATQALMVLGEVKPPPGLEMPRDLNLAKQTIEILAMLELKTKGNLVEDEKKLIENILHSLRLAYIKASSK